MTTTRIDKIQAMLRDEPRDSFLRYTLAMEYRKLDENEKSLALLTELANNEEPRYVAAFFMAAQQLVELDRIEEARTILRDGIEEARSQNNHHAAAEMSELLSEIGK
jgi:thioredoxin-like negative regulator of GroEL